MTTDDALYVQWDPSQAADEAYRFGTHTILSPAAILPDEWEDTPSWYRIILDWDLAWWEEEFWGHDEPSSASEWDRAEALQLGDEDPSRPWVLTDRDVWHPNPFYTGPAVPHPEWDDELRDEDQDPTRPF